MLSFEILTEEVKRQNAIKRTEVLNATLSSVRKHDRVMMATKVFG